MFTTKVTALFIGILFLSVLTHAQVGVGTTSPDNNAVLDVNSSSKGILIPRMTTIQRETLTTNNPAQGMMVYDIDLDVMFVYYGGQWYAMNAWKTEYRTDQNNQAATMTTMTATGVNHGNVGIGTATPTEKLEISGKVKATEFSGYGMAPVGAIVHWSGSTAPAGWAICDGRTVNGYTTPDLRGRFVVGYNPGKTDYNEPGNLSEKSTTNGKTGGLDQVAISLSEMPSHNHSGSAGGAGGHRHTYDGYTKRTQNICDDQNDNISAPDVWNWSDTRTTIGVNNHTHSVSIGSTGGGGAHENRPKFYSLAYIMRVY